MSTRIQNEAEALKVALSIIEKLSPIDEKWYLEVDSMTLDELKIMAQKLRLRRYVEQPHLDSSKAVPDDYR